MNPTRKVLRGDPRSHSAAFHNQVVDAVRRVQTQQRVNEVAARGAPLPVGLVRIRNNSGAAVTRFGVLAVGGVATDPDESSLGFQNGPILEGVEPDELHRSWVIAQQPIRNGAVGRAVAIGVTIARVYVEDEEFTPKFADSGVLGETDYLIGSGAGPARVLWRASGAGEQWALVAVGAGSTGAFPITMQQTGGVEGDADGPATWTYTITSDDGAELATEVGPTVAPHRFRRPAVGVMVAATYGLAHYGPDGILVVDWCNEVAEQEAC
jgi:hypothetical protein